MLILRRPAAGFGSRPIMVAAVILFVDAEHESAYAKEFGDFLLANRTRIAYNLEDISGHRCFLQRYPRVDPALLDEYDIQAVFISGSSTEPHDYDSAEQEGLRAIVREGSVPVFGFCGGWQFMAESFGHPIEKIGPLDNGADDPDPGFMPGWKTENGYMPVELFGSHPLLEGLGEHPVFRQFHGWEIKVLPEGFSNYARSDVSEHQLAVDDARKMLGTQFHPEYFTDEHPAGRRLIENFCVWSGLISS